MGYRQYRQDYAFPLAASRTNGVILASLPIGDVELMEVFGLRVYISTAGSASGCAVDLKFDGGSASASVNYGTATGFKKDATASRFPLRFTGVSGGTSRIDLVQNTTDSSGIGTLFLDCSKMFKY